MCVLIESLQKLSCSMIAIFRDRFFSLFVAKTQANDLKICLIFCLSTRKNIRWKSARKYTNLNSRNFTTKNSTRWSKLRRHFKSYAVKTSRFDNNSIQNFVVRQDKQLIEWLWYDKKLDSVVFKVWTMNDQRRLLLSIVFREWTSKKRIISTEIKEHCWVWRDWSINSNVKKTEWIQIWQLVRQDVIKIIWDNDETSVNVLSNVSHFMSIRNNMSSKRKEVRRSRRILFVIWFSLRHSIIIIFVLFFCHFYHWTSSNDLVRNFESNSNYSENRKRFVIRRTRIHNLLILLNIE